MPKTSALVSALLATLGTCSAVVAAEPDAPPPSLLIPAKPALRYDTDPEKTVHVINWKDYMDPLVVAEFTAETGIQVELDDLESNDSLDTALRTRHSGYDVVFPSGKYLQAQIKLGLFRPLEKTHLTNLANADPNLTKQLAKFDPGNAHAVTYMFGSAGIAFNAEAVTAAMPNAPVNSLAMIWDPWVVAKFAHCGVAVIDSPSEVVGTVLIYMGKDANSEKLEDLAAAEKVMLAARPSIRLIDSDYVDELASGDICLGLDWSSDTLNAKVDAANEGKTFKIGFRVPREGALIYLDTMAIPADARHVKNAHIFINYLLRDDVAAKNSKFTSFPNGNGLSWLATGDEIYDDENFFPATALREKMVPDLPESEEYARQLARTWARFVAGGKQH